MLGTNRCDAKLAFTCEKNKTKAKQIQVGPNAKEPSRTETPQMFSVDSSTQPESHEQVAQKNRSHRGFHCARQV